MAHAMLEVGRNCSHIATADRVAILIENDAYFQVVEKALERAQRSVMLLGWQFDPRTQLDPLNPPHGAAGEIGYQMRRLVRTHPDLRIRLLVWNSPLPIAASQGMFPQRAVRWFNKNPVDLRLVKPLSVGAAHHQKILVIDDKLAFCAGGDISVDRWDTTLHLDEEAHRVLPSGELRKPRHEVVMMMDGEAALALGHLARDAWQWVTEETLDPVSVDYDPWPEDTIPTLTHARVGISQTVSGGSGTQSRREVEALFLDMISGAKELIYLENQYFTSPAIAAALARRLAEPDGPEVVLVTTRTSPSWFDRTTMDTARAQVLFTLESADHRNRFFAFAPLTPEGKRIIVHAKMTIVDDEMIRIGSTNLNNRSMGYDTECDVAAEPGDAAGHQAIAAYRRRSIAHFMGVDTAAYAAAEARLGSVGEAILSFGDTRMDLLGYDKPTRLEKAIASWQIGDPVSTEDVFQPWKREAHALFLPPVREDEQADGPQPRPHHPPR